MISSNQGTYVGVGTFGNARRTGITLIEAMGGGNVRAARSSPEYVVVVVNVILALEAVLAFVSEFVGLEVGIVVTTKGSTLDLEALPRTNVAAGGAFSILVARVRRARRNIE